MYIEKILQKPVDAYGDVRTLVRGLPYQCPNDWEKVLASLDENSNLFLVKEPDNPKDKLAIAAYLDDRRIGYVAASDNSKIWLYLTDEKMPCTFLQRYEASFTISFENPRHLFKGLSFCEIYKDKCGETDMQFPVFVIPFLADSRDENFIWFDDRIVIDDLEKNIPDFRRKLAARLIVLAGRKNSKGGYYYYLPYINSPVADIEDDTIKSIIDKYGFVIGLPDVPMMTAQGVIITDLHITYLPKNCFNAFNTTHQSELVFIFEEKSNLSIVHSEANSDNKSMIIKSELPDMGDSITSYEVTDLPEGGKHVEMDIIVPEEGNENYDFYLYDFCIRDKDQIGLIVHYMKRYEQNLESTPFIMMGRASFEVNDLYAFYSLDNDIIFDFIIDEIIISWIKEAGLVMGKVKSIEMTSNNSLDVCMSVSKRKGGEKQFKQATEEAMDYIEDVVWSIASPSLEKRIIAHVNKYLKGTIDKPYQVLAESWGQYESLDGAEIAFIEDDDIMELAEENEGVVGYITNFRYGKSGINVEFTIRVSRSIPKL